MNTFWLIVAAMVVAALLFLVPALLRKRSLRELDRDAQNVRIARERLADLEAEHREGVLSDQDLEQGKLELEQTLLVDLGSEGADQVRASALPGRAAAVALTLLVPLSAVALYLGIGAPQHLDAQGPGGPTMAAHAGAGGSGELPPLEELVGRLEQRLAENPQDANGWFLLGRTYMNVERHEDAVDAFERVLELAGDHPTVLVSLADAIAMSRDGDMSGRPSELVQQALEQDPSHTTALWMAGLAAQERGEPKKALGYWERLRPLLADEPASQQQVADLISRTRRELGMPPQETQLPSISGAPEPAASPASSSGRSVEVKVRLAEPVREQAEPGDTVFVFARAAEGPPMPLAVARKQVRDLPLTVTLDDSMAMTPAMRLSSFERVQILARVSKSGSARAGSGDLESEAVVVDEGESGPVELEIARVVP